MILITTQQVNIAITAKIPVFLFSEDVDMLLEIVLTERSSIGRVTGNSVAICDDMQGFVSITDPILFWMYHIVKCI